MTMNLNKPIIFLEINLLFFFVSTKKFQRNFLLVLFAQTLTMHILQNVRFLNVHVNDGTQHEDLCRESNPRLLGLWVSSVGVENSLFEFSCYLICIQDQVSRRLLARTM